MTDLENRADEYAIKVAEKNVMPKDGFAEHLIRQAYLDATKAETALLSQHILDLQKDKGELTDRVKELEAQNEILERRIIRAKECMKKLLFIINSEPSNYNCKGLVQDADDFIHNRTCNIRKSGNHCITEEPCIMCDN